MTKDFDEQKHENINKKYDVILKIRNLEIKLLWQRSLFFWGFIASSLLGYINSLKGHSYLISLLIGCFGLFCSFCWHWVNKSSKNWQEYWEKELEKIENEVTGELFKESNKKVERFSVSEITKKVSFYNIVVWIILIVHILYLRLKSNGTLFTNCVEKIEFVVNSPILDIFVIIVLVSLLRQIHLSVKRPKESKEKN